MSNTPSCCRGELLRVCLWLSPPDQSYRGQRVLMKWDSDGLSLHTSRRTSQGFNSSHQPHTHHHTLVARLAQSFSRHRPSDRRLRPSCALRSLLLPNQLAVSTDILTYYCTLETLTFKLSVCSFSSRISPPQKTMMRTADRPPHSPSALQPVI